MSANEDVPVNGIPGPLPTGERLLWQGAPRWQTLAVHAMHVRKLAIYFAALLAWYAVTKVSMGVPAGAIVVGTARLGGLALAPLVLLTGYAWLTARTTTYSITNRRVVMRFGIALPMTLNLPFRTIDGADMKLGAGGVGDITLAPSSRERLAYPLLWPHARPWRITRVQPMLRGVPDASRVAQTLARALAAAAAVPVQPVPESRAATQGQGGGARAAAAA